jgi:hypothetical protein
MTHFAPIEICMCTKYNYLFTIKVITCVHPFTNNMQFKNLTKGLILDHTNYIVVFFTFCPLPTSVHVCIYSHMTSFFVNMTYVASIEMQIYFWQLHFDETLNVMI